MQQCASQATCPKATVRLAWVGSDFMLYLMSWLPDERILSDARTPMGATQGIFRYSITRMTFGVLHKLCCWRRLDSLLYVQNQQSRAAIYSKIRLYR